MFQSRDADSDTGGGVNTSGHVQRQTRPLILPDKFSGVEDFSKWTAHFNSVSVINGWSDDDKYKWLNAHVTGKARVTIARLQQQLTRPTYEQAIDALRLRFDPPGRKELFKANLRTRSKRADESWGDYGDAIVLLVDKAYPDLQDEAKDMLALNKFFEELVDPQILLAVRQQRPRTIAEAVQATIEYETYLVVSSIDRPRDVLTQQVAEPNSNGIVFNQDVIFNVVDKLASQIETLEGLLKHSKHTEVYDNCGCLMQCSRQCTKCLVSQKTRETSIPTHEVPKDQTKVRYKISELSQ